MRVAIVLTLLLAGSPAFAQTAWTGRVRAGVSVGVQPASAGLTTATTAPAYLEPAPISAEIPRSTIPVVDAGLAVRLVGDFGVGVAVSRTGTSNDARVSASIPHPFHFDRPRPIDGQAFGLQRAETAVHASAVYVFGTSRRTDVALVGGVTYFRVRQEVVTDVTYAEVYPFDTATFSSASYAELVASRTGYHAGVDVAWRRSPRWAIGGLIRFARARVPFDINGARAGTMETGGLHAAAGLRLSFGHVPGRP